MAELLVAYLGVAQIVGQVIVTAAVVAASMAISRQQQSRAQRKATDEYNRTLRDQMVTVKGGVNPRPLVYGRTALGGQLIYAESFGARKEVLLMVIALAHGESEEIETVYFNDTPLTISGQTVTNAPYYATGDAPQMYQATVPGSAPYTVTLPATPSAVETIQDGQWGWGGGDNGPPPVLAAGTDYTVAGAVITFDSARAGHPVQIAYRTTSSTSYAYVWKLLGSPTQDISGTMLALGAPSWTAADKCQGMTGLIVQLIYAENVWESGIPNIKAVVKGRKVYDPRSATTVWTSNAALCARDYLTFQYGVNASGTKIDDTATIAAANLCDEDVQLTATPTYQERYTFDGVISTGDDRLNNLELFAQAMAGSVNYSAGKWRIRPGAYTAPALTLDEAKLSDAGAIQIVPFASRRDLINGAKGTYINAAAGWIEDQFPEWTSATFVTEDGGAALTTAVTLPQVTDVSRAQRLAKIAVYRAREQLTLQVACNFSTYHWQVGDMVSATIARYGFSAKPFRIIRRGFSVEGGMAFTLREEPSGIYDWNLGEASILTAAGNTTLPSPTTVAAPTITGITSAQWLYKAGDGTFVARIRVAVTSPADEYVRQGGKLQLQCKRGDWSGDWILIEASGDATQIWIDPAFDAQNYLIRVRAVNSAGFASQWTASQVHTCQGRPGQIVNLLRNSDWTEDLGYPAGITFYSDTRALRNWSPGGNPASYARNYDTGKTWNIGLGGCCIYIPSNTVGHYAYIYQDVPVQAGVEYEASVYVAIHRANVIFYLRFLNAAKDTVTLDVTDVRDSGVSVVGEPYMPMSNPRLWCKGTAPVGTAYAQIICLVECTALSSPYPFSAWSNALLCVAPSGVTRETATPWIDEGNTTPLGVSDPYIVEAIGYGSKWGIFVSGGAATLTYSGTPATFGIQLKAGDSILVEVEYSGASNRGAGAPYYSAVASDVVIDGSGHVPFRISGTNRSGNAKYTEDTWGPVSSTDKYLGTHVVMYTAASDQGVTVYGVGGTHSGDDTDANACFTRLRIQRIRI